MSNIRAFETTTDKVIAASKRKGKKETIASIAERIGAKPWQVASWRTRTEPPEWAMEAVARAYGLEKQYPATNAQDLAQTLQEPEQMEIAAIRSDILLQLAASRLEISNYQTFLLHLNFEMDEMERTATGEALEAVQRARALVSELYRKHIAPK